MIRFFLRIYDSLVGRRGLVLLLFSALCALLVWRIFY